MSWYTLQTKPNYEAKVMGEIEKRLRDKGLQIREIFSPEELVVEFKDGKKKERKKRLYTNYIFLEMDYSDEIFHSLKSISGVVGFVSNRPTPEKDIQEMKAQVSGEAPKPKVVYDPGSRVRITDGSFADFQGVVSSVNYDKNVAKVTVTIFNRETDVDIELGMLELAK